jgi:hypothetical protein
MRSCTKTACHINPSLLIKTLGKLGRKKKRSKNNLQDGEMCANCFVLEKTLLDESNQKEGLLKCSRCQQLKYCKSRMSTRTLEKGPQEAMQKGGKLAASSADKKSPP